MLLLCYVLREAYIKLRVLSGKVDPHTDPPVLDLFRSFFLRSSVAPSALMRPAYFDETRLT